MKKSRLIEIVKEEILNEASNRLDYTDRNTGLLDAAKKLEKLSKDLKSLKIKSLADKKMIEYKYYRLGPGSAEWDNAINTIDSMINFLKRDNSNKLDKNGNLK